MSLDADGRHQQVRIKATMSADDWTERSGRLYERAILDGDTGALAVADRELDAVEADLALARGRVMHGRFLAVRNEDPERAAEDPQELTWFERAAGLYRGLDDVRGEGAALFWVGCCHQVVRRDDGAAVPVLERSLELATLPDDWTRPRSGWRNRPGCAGRSGTCLAWRRTWSGWPTSPPGRAGLTTHGSCSTRRARSLRPAALTSSRARSRKPARNCRQRCRGQRLTGRPGASQLAAPA
jgi:hypothetical protein